ncbi:hypothetical protein HNY73_019074 [Argiope bruennichi]|uniref:Uncharacterized protein n=1 Tax=Argiope bruennichi TaxID=94029 RepID=A0A8T0EJ89_ARGBR|nr:hypothetical protein HNY73_019074 [Argiope bruennichi]
MIENLIYFISPAQRGLDSTHRVNMKFAFCLPTAGKIDWLGRCLEVNTKDFCGEHQSDYFYKSALDSVIKLNKLLCNEVILPAEDNLHELVILGLPRLIESTVAILTLP